MPQSSNIYFRLILIIPLLILLFVINTVIIEKDFSMDSNFSSYVSEDIVNPDLTGFMRFMTALGDHEIVVGIYILLILLLLFVWEDKAKAMKVPLIGFSALGLMYLLKNLFARERPEFTLLHASGFSFPSGHSLNSMVLYGLIIFVVNKYVSNVYLKIALIGLLVCVVLLIGFSRIYLGVHYLTDVLAGFCCGLLWLSLALYLAKFD
ncbi:phosphatase PAP2 family protein [Pseudoxanthomonas sp. SGD-10]|nr:phosphatase PAP2 family protein [Pseudoxanthomonas sp. SGD-10]